MEPPAHRTLLLHVQYDGTDFCGWQYQPRQRTVQGELMARIGAMVHHPVDLQASSRTDAGVHAQAMPVVFDTPRTIPPRGFLRGLNVNLPPDLSVLDVSEQPFGFRPRDASVAKTYLYRYQLGSRRALHDRYTWWLRRPSLNIEAMRAGAMHFVGEHDFEAFRSIHCDSRSTERFIHDINLSDPDEDEVVTLTITGNAFLRNMVRIMAGSLFNVGLGRLPPDWIPAAIASGRRQDGSQTAPASGLMLAKVHFSGYPRIAKRPMPQLGADPAQPVGQLPTLEPS